MSTQVLTRTTQLLRHLSSSQGEGRRLVDLCRLSGLERGTVHRLLKDLIVEGMVSQDLYSRSYFLGMAIFEMGITVPAMRVREICSPHLSQLSEQIGETIVLTVRSGNDGVCIDCVNGRDLLGDKQMLGVRTALIVGVPNMAMLGRLPVAEMRKISLDHLHRAGHQDSALALGLLEAQVLKNHGRGYATREEGEFIGGPVLGVHLEDKAGRVIAAVSIFAAEALGSSSAFDELVAALRSTQSAITQEFQRCAFNLSSV